jgi:DNA-binding beta-propeller fold protein YncE
MIVGAGEFRYRVVEGWGQGPEGREFGGVVPSVAVNSQDRVFIARRSPPAILVYDREGRYLAAWGQDVLHSPHSVWISPDDRVYVADMEDHTVRTFTLEGELLSTLGTVGLPGAPGKPFNKPTWAVLSASGELFVSDGYGQQRVHRFAADGRLLLSWGEHGSGPGQFTLPHGIRVDPKGRVLVLDRETNHRLQIFDVEGNFLGQWADLKGPNDLYIDRNNHVYIAEGPQRISIFDLDGNLLARWGEKGERAGQFTDSPHGIWADSHGDLYVAEVPRLPNRLQKFERI